MREKLIEALCEDLPDLTNLSPSSCRLMAPALLDAILEAMRKPDGGTVAAGYAAGNGDEADALNVFRAMIDHIRAA